MTQFEKYVRWFRNNAPQENNGRKVVILSNKTKAGKRVIEMSSRFEGYRLEDVYKYHSEEKEFAYQDVYNMYSNDITAHYFRICSHNCQAFTVAWLNNKGLIFITSKKEYHVLDEREYYKRMEG